MMRRVVLSVAACLSVHASSQAIAADSKWLEARSAHFTVVTDNGERSGRDVLQQFEQVRAAIHTLWPWASVDLDKPILVLAVKNEDGMKALVPSAWEQKDAVRPSSLLVTGPDRHYIALRADIRSRDMEGTVNPYNSAYWSYASLILRSGLKADLPMWFTIGIASVMSNINVTNSTIKVGEIIPWHLRTLHSVVERPRLSELVKVEGGSSWLTGTNRPMFDAVAWAFVHYLMFGEQGAHVEQFNKFIALLLDGKRSNDALIAAFGDIDSFNGGFASYVNRPLWAYARINADAKIGAENYPSRLLSAAEAAGLRASFHVVTNRLPDAHNVVDKFSGADPRQPILFEAQGMLADAERRPADARTAFARAMELGSTNFYAYYRWAALSQAPATDEATRTQNEAALSRSIELNGRFAPAQSLLAFSKAQGGHPEEAVTAAERAVTLQPDNLGTRIALIRILVTLGRQDAAQREVASAMALAKNDAQRQQLQQLAAPQTARTTGFGAAGVGSSVSAAPLLVAGTTDVYQLGGSIVPPKVVRNVTPRYTADGIGQKIQGVVVVRCVVNTDGSVSDAKVVRSLDTKFGLDDEALEAARQWRFTPGLLRGVPVRVQVTIDMSFTLK